jgi:hypothetical protein
MTVFTVVLIIERDCDVNVWTTDTGDKAIALKNKLVFQFAKDYGIKFLEEKKENDRYYCYIEGGHTDRQIIIEKTEL